MKTMWQSHGMMITYIVILLVSLSLHLGATSAQSPTDTSMCTYQETRQTVPRNPNTNKPYTPEERNQEPFAGASISKEDIKQCLQAKQPIQNHHIVFEEYRDAWKELAEETGDYAIPLLILGGVLHAKTPYIRRDETGLRAFHDPTITDASQLTEEERKTFGITEKQRPIALIRSMIKWNGVFVDSAVTTSLEGSPHVLFSERADFEGAQFSRAADFQDAVFSKEASFKFVQFLTGADFERAQLSERADFEGAQFSWQADFQDAVFSKEASFKFVQFLTGAMFDKAQFSERADFDEAQFSERASFREARFTTEAHFFKTQFSMVADFRGGQFNHKTSFTSAQFSGEASFREVQFGKEADFRYAQFRENASFTDTQFGKEAFFWTQFSKAADFNGATFKGNVDFRAVRVEETLTFDNTTWEGRVDLRDMSAKELHWDSKAAPSEVKGICDLREASFGKATFTEIRFQDVLDFSRTTFGQYKIKNEGGKDEVKEHPSPQVLFENNTFEKESDFRHVTFSGLALLTNNRFRSRLDLTHASFTTPNSFLCLSFNDIGRFVLEPEHIDKSQHLGNPPSVSPYDLLIDKPLRSLFTEPLQISRVRQVVELEDRPQCGFADTTSNTKNALANRQAERLDAIYKTIGQAFREANNQGGVNEAWYLQKVVEQNQQRPIWCWFSRVFLDIPSRYTVDVWRTVWVSIMIMLGFWFLYVLELQDLLWSEDADHRTIQVPEYSTRQRAFRLRLFEPIHRTSIQCTRQIIPWRDAAALSFRAFTKIGLSTAYPNTWRLKVLTSIEWILGVYMLIHFIVAVKNNLPFILPFLGVVN
jgi:uncharacterized protein YjbI with pentapeptide repeats